MVKVLAEVIGHHHVIVPICRINCSRNSDLRPRVVVPIHSDVFTMIYRRGVGRLRPAPQEVLRCASGEQSAIPVKGCAVARLHIRGEKL